MEEPVTPPPGGGSTPPHAPAQWRGREREVDDHDHDDEAGRRVRQRAEPPQPRQAHAGGRVEPQRPPPQPRQAHAGGRVEPQDPLPQPRTHAERVAAGEFYQGLSDEQRRAVRDCLTGRNVFITGVAGTGKSFTLQRVIEALRSMYPKRDPHNRTVAVCAPTGVSAINVGGTTLHSLAGCGIPTYAQDVRFRRKDENKEMWQGLSALVIDEISMVSGEFLEWLDATVRSIRAETRPGRGLLNRPFGGIQLIFCGDFLQLPPIGKDSVSCPRGLSSPVPDFVAAWEKAVPVGAVAELESAFAFQTATWREARLECVELKEVHRQEDEVLVSHLKWLRNGGVGPRPLPEHVGEFSGLCGHSYFQRRFVRALPPRDGIEATRLFPTNKEVGEINEQRMASLDRTLASYPAIDSVEVDVRVPIEKYAECEQELWGDDDFFRDNLQAAEVVELKVGAQVMLTKNEPLGVGARPGVERLVNGSRGVVTGYSFADPNSPEFNERAWLRALHPEARGRVPMEERDVVEGDAVMGTEWAPVFPRGREEVITPASFDREHYACGVCTRVQAWAISIHKSQGASLDYVTVDLHKAFCDAQAYVGVSRARSPDGLQVVGYRRSAARADPRAVKFYRSLALGPGELERHLEAEGLWWWPLLGFLRPRYRDTRSLSNIREWLQVFRRSQTFNGWLRLYLPRWARARAADLPDARPGPRGVYEEEMHACMHAGLGGGGGGGGGGGDGPYTPQKDAPLRLFLPESEGEDEEPPTQVYQVHQSPGTQLYIGAM